MSRTNASKSAAGSKTTSRSNVGNVLTLSHRTPGSLPIHLRRRFDFRPRPLGHIDAIDKAPVHPLLSIQMQVIGHRRREIQAGVVVLLVLWGMITKDIVG